MDTGLPCRVARRRRVVPWLEAVARAVERRTKPREMAKDHADEVVVVHPGDAGAGVEVGGEILGNEAISLEPARRHPGQDAARPLPETRPGRPTPPPTP